MQKCGRNLRNRRIGRVPGVFEPREVKGLADVSKLRDAKTVAAVSWLQVVQY